MQASEQLRKSRDILESRWEKLGFDQLLAEERDYLVLWWLRAEVNNGSFHQYFLNSAGDDAMQALRALETLGATEAHRILGQAITIFERVGGYSADRDERWDRLDALPEEIEAFSHVTREFLDRAENFVTIALERVHEVYRSRGIAGS